jgi:hypothetical protein
MVGHVMSGVDGERGGGSQVMMVVRKLNVSVFSLLSLYLFVRRQNPWPIFNSTVAACIAERMQNVPYIMA